MLEVIQMLNYWKSCIENNELNAAARDYSY